MGVQRWELDRGIGRQPLADGPVARVVIGADLDPGGVVTIPVGERVRLENHGDTEARLLVVLTPPDFAAAVQTWPEVSHEREAGRCG